MGLPLSVDGLLVRGHRGRALLSVPALHVPRGTLLGVRGPSGAGKSTLLHALGGLLEAEGRVRWGDTCLTTLPEARRAAFRADRIGLIFQDFLLFDELSPLANAGVSALFSPRGARARRRARARDRLARLGIAPTGRTVASFSGGERQRVAVARALVGDPPILLADEPTASLDRASADRLIGDLTALVRATGKTFIAVSHDARLLAGMDRLITIEDGTVVADAVTA